MKKLESRQPRQVAQESVEYPQPVFQHRSVSDYAPKNSTLLEEKVVER